MSICKITLSANAGVSIILDGVRMWVDALHCNKVDGFSCLSDALWLEMCHSDDFAPPDVIFFSHKHPDHFSKELTDSAIFLWPDAKIVMPGSIFSGQINLSQDVESIKYRNILLTFIRLPHEGPQYKDIPNYGLLMEYEGFTILAAGDCELGSAHLAKFIAGSAIDLAILDFPWLTLCKGREFIQNIICPKHVIINHLPFEQDDINSYRSAVDRIATKYKDEFDIHILKDPMQSISFKVSEG